MDWTPLHLRNKSKCARTYFFCMVKHPWIPNPYSMIHASKATFRATYTKIMPEVNNVEVTTDIDNAKQELPEILDDINT